MRDALPEQKVPQSVSGVDAGTVERAHDVMLGLGHLLPVHRPVRVAQDGPGRLQIGRHQEGWPVDAVKSGTID